jgi:hypothetical protein
MKKIFILFLTLASFSLAAQKPEIQINLYTNYVFEDGFEVFDNSTSFYNGTIEDGFQWGIGLEVKPHPMMGAELIYIRQDTKVPVNYWYLNNIDRVIDASVNYIMLGGTRYSAARSSDSKVEGYGGFSFGMVVYDNKEPIVDEPNTITKFAWGAKLGANIWVTPKVGLKIQGHMLSGVQAWGGGLYLGTGGAGAGVNAFSTLYQFSLGGGLVFRLGE